MKSLPDRIQRAVAYLSQYLAGEEGKRLRALPFDAQLVYIASILICDDHGFVDQDDLARVLEDDEFQSATFVVASRAGLVSASSSAAARQN